MFLGLVGQGGGLAHPGGAGGSGLDPPLTGAGRGGGGGGEGGAGLWEGGGAHRPRLEHREKRRSTG